MPPLLSVEKLEAGYGPINVLHGVSLAVEPGEIVAMIGANGAGKTTTLMCVSGVVRARGGKVLFDGKDLTRLPAHDVVKLGLTQAPEGRKIFPRLTVLENLQMGAFTRPDPDGVAKDMEKVYGLFPILRERRHQAGGLLSGGQQQMLAIGRALMARPKLLLLDEPSLGLAPQVVVQIFDVIRELNRQGVSVLLVEQNARMALKVAHRGYVLETGRITFSDRADVLLNDPRIRAAAKRTVMKITRVTTDHLRVPTGKPGRIPLAGGRPAPDAVDLVLVHLETDAGLAGLGLTYLLGPGATVLRSLIDTELSPLVVGEDPRDTDRLFAKAEARFRGVGFTGLAARAYAAIDVALWDAKAKAAGLPLFRLLGGGRPAAPFFVSDVGARGRDAADVVKAARPLLKDGATGVRLEVGSGDVQADADRVREVSDGLGEDAAVSVAADGRFDLGTATALAHFFEDQGIELFEDPIPAADEPGYRKLAELMEVPLAVGSSFDTREQFFRVIRDGAVRTVRPDVCRLGGITPLLKVAAVAEAFHVAVSPVRLSEVGVHLACGLGVVPHVDSVAWFRDVFTGGPTVGSGKLVPPGEPGLGITVNEDVARFRLAETPLSAYHEGHPFPTEARPMPSNPEKRVQELHLTLPPAPKPVAVYKTAVRQGNILYVSGHGPLKADRTMITGRVGQDLTLDQGKDAARQVGLAILATIRDVLGSLDKVKRLVKTLGWVNCTVEFTDQPKVINGFSELMKDVFGEDAGVGARSAVSAHTLPGGIAVEIECIFEVE